MNINADIPNISQQILAMYQKTTCDDEAELFSSKLKFNVIETCKYYSLCQRTETENLMVLINAEKTFDKIKQQFLIKLLKYDKDETQQLW